MISARLPAMIQREQSLAAFFSHGKNSPRGGKKCVFPEKVIW